MTDRPSDWMFRRPPEPGARLVAPAAARNAAPLAEILARLIPDGATVLEIASGTGQHAVYFAGRIVRSTWLPSDPDPEARASIEAWRAAAGLPNLKPALAIDASEPGWEQSVPAVSAVLCINMIHIAPWSACLGLLAGAGALLPAGAPLVLYGPFRRAGVPTAPSNEAFDESLRMRDPAWGLRELEAVTAAGRPHGFALDAIVEMPANNLVVVLRRGGDSAPAHKPL